MRVDKLTLRDFTVFGETEFDFSPGLNVLIGANGTGKTHVLKLLYSIIRTMAIRGEIVPKPEDVHLGVNLLLSKPILRRLEKTFRPEPSRSSRSTLTSLIRRGANDADVIAQGDFGVTMIRLGGDDPDADIRTFTPRRGLPVFVPASEVLSMYAGFIAAYERRELSFDETFRNLCVDFSATPLRSIEPSALADLVAKLDDAVGGKTVLRGDRFYVRRIGTLRCRCWRKGFGSSRPLRI